jgi:uncharacterized membrane protein
MPKLMIERSVVIQAPVDVVYENHLERLPLLDLLEVESLKVAG